jgi:hypothetical protein
MMLSHLATVAVAAATGFVSMSGNAVAKMLAYANSQGTGGYEFQIPQVEIFTARALPTTGIIGLAIVAVACVVAGAFIILRRR